MSSSRRHQGSWHDHITRDRVLLALLALLLIVLAFFAWQAARASSSLRLAASQAGVLQSQIVAGDDVGAKATLRSLQDSAAKAESASDGLLWDIGSKVPFVGKNIKAVQTVSSVVSQISDEALPPVVDVSQQLNLNTFSPKDGKVDLQAITGVEPSIIKAHQALIVAQRELASVDAESLLVPLQGPVGDIQEKVDGATEVASTSELAAKLLPTMLGAKGERRYLLLIQNNAEIRSTGGISGSYAILRAKKGRLSMGFQGSIADLPPATKPVLKMTKNESTVYSPTLVTDIRDVNFTPDFPRSGEIAKALVKKGLGEDVDGVISVDPVALSFILAGTGPVANATSTALDQFNVVDVLLNQTYQLVPDNKQQDDVFKVAAKTIFNTIKSGRADSRLVVDGMVRAANENRLLIWSSHEDEQSLIDPSGVSGRLSGDGGATPHVGLYLGDAASTKMEYYLEYNTTARASRCLPGDVQELNTSTTLTSSAPRDLALMSKSVTGDGTFTPRGTMRLVLRFYAPYAGGFTDVRVDGKPQTVYADSHRGRNVTKVLITLRPGQSRTVTTSMISGRNQDKDGVFSTTPGVQSTPNDVTIKSACG